MDADGTTLRELLSTTSRPGIPGSRGSVLTDDGALHRFVNVYVNDEDVRYLGSLETEVGRATPSRSCPRSPGG